MSDSSAVSTQQSPSSRVNTPSRAIFFVSDGTGITAEVLGKGLLSQFEGINFRQIRVPFVDSPEKAEECLRRIREVSHGMQPSLRIQNWTVPKAVMAE